MASNSASPSRSPQILHFNLFYSILVFRCFYIGCVRQYKGTQFTLEELKFVVYFVISRLVVIGVVVCGEITRNNFNLWANGLTQRHVKIICSIFGFRSFAGYIDKSDTNTNQQSYKSFSVLLNLSSSLATRSFGHVTALKIVFLAFFK